MRPTFIVVPVYLIIYSFFLVACQGKKRSEAQPLLDQAEALMQTHPDSALHILAEEIDTKSLSPRQQADWAILLTQAEDKNLFTHTTDSTIRIALSYYEKKNHPLRLMQACYYAGRVYQDMGDAPRCQDYFLKALQTGAAADHLTFAGMVYGNLARLYIFQDAWQEAMPQLQEAARCFGEMGDSVRLSYIFRDMGRTLSMLDRPDSAAWYYEKALVHIPPQEELFIINELIHLYTCQEEYTRAYGHMQELMPVVEAVTEETDALMPVYLSIGNLYRHLGKADSASYWLHKVVDESVWGDEIPPTETEVSAWYYLAQLAREQRNWETYARFRESHDKVAEELMEATYREQLVEMQYRYDYEVHKNESAQLRIDYLSQERDYYRLVVLSALLLAGCCVILYYLRRRIRKHRELKSRIHALTRESEQLIGRNNKKIKQLEKEIVRLKTENNDTLEEVLIQKQRAGELEKSPIAQKYLQGNLWEPTNQDKKELQETVDRIFPSFAFRLQKAFPDMDKTERYLCYLNKIGITSNTKIAHFTGMSPTGIASRRDRLYERHLKSKSNRIIFKEFIDSL
ncbi:tetratricopeptide (TPR) repeat protein [Parabacteroides sp. PFB2-10]|uniref:tetratricopeptide repeat protein n=1 Tax=Parabacteroides sp. PFB2-10 TaxID=1742405 RepID=UPI002475D769|nr:hypothetical protein [Parabacteroides sp. PFB2-10]MDH6311390.1 tetratricopeptide (TPR) repeat protein [Parabacteroides sp. PFB2-10]